jgi:hypothetical protein
MTKEHHEVNQFVTLWNMLRQVQLTDQRDEIAWRFSTSGSYTTHSAYQQVQILLLADPAEQIMDCRQDRKTRQGYQYQHQHHLSALTHKKWIRPAHDGQMFRLQKYMDCSLFLDGNRVSATTTAKLSPASVMAAWHAS